MRRATHARRLQSGFIARFQDFVLIQMAHRLDTRNIGEMKMDLEAATLLVYHAAWLKDTQGSRITTEASMAKCYASERAFAVIDAAMQLMGAMGLTRGVTVERLFRDIRPARIFEGASEVQKLIIGRNVIREWAGSMPGTRS